MLHPYDVLVIGGGVSGMCAAAAAARGGKDVIVLEGSDHIGWKLALTGDGCGNFTNEKFGPEYYYDADPQFLGSVFGRFSNQDLMDWFIQAGVDLKKERGRVYPACGQAADLADVLRLQMNRHFVRVDHYQKVVEIERKDEDLFEVRCVNRVYHARRVILAAGSKAMAQTDSGDSGYRLAESLGMKVRKPLPALTALRLSSPCTSEWDGMRCDASVTILTDGVSAGSAGGSLELTASGLSGIPAFNVSRYVSRALDEGRQVQAVISFLPGLTEQEAYEFLTRRLDRVNEYLARDFLLGLIPKKLARILIREAGIRHSRPIHYLKEEEIRRLAQVMAGFTCEVTGHGNFGQSQVCTGGVLTSEVDPETLESRAVKGLYLAGGLLDVDGMYDGYNLQWDFSSGFAAGEAAGRSAAG